MAQNWTSTANRRVRELGRAFRMAPNPADHPNDADNRRMRVELDAIRARFPDHS